MRQVICSFSPYGIIEPPTSKSYAHRYLIGAFLANKLFEIKNIYYSRDVLATLGSLNSLGAKFEINDRTTTYFKREYQSSDDEIIINCDESASTLRMILPIACYLYKHVKFVGAKSLFKRPLNPYFDIFDTQNIEYKLGDDYLEVNGKLEITDFTVKGDISSQFISGLLFLLALVENSSKLTVLEPIESKNYIDMTLKALKDFGYSFKIENNSYSFSKREKGLKEATIEIDYSLASTYMVLGSLKGIVKVVGLSKDSLQGDKEIINILKNANACIVEDEEGLTFSPNDTPLKPFTVDVSNCIDLAPNLIVLASFINGTSYIKNVQRLTIKESDRLNNMIKELSKAGVSIHFLKNELVIEGKNSYPGHIEFESFNDHRIAMALSIFMICSDDRSVLNDSEAINKSYPTFFNDLGGLVKWN